MIIRAGIDSADGHETRKEGMCSGSKHKYFNCWAWHLKLLPPQRSGGFPTLRSIAVQKGLPSGHIAGSTDCEAHPRKVESHIWYTATVWGEVT